MLFSDYITLLKAHFCKTISNEELCGILFDAVILPLDLKNKNGEPLLLDKTTISRIMNDKQNIPRQIRDSIYEPAVLSGLVSYFDDNIVSELVPKRDDLCFQILNKLKEDRMLSPQHLAEFQMLASPSSIGAFLAEVFAYVAMVDVHSDITQKPARILDSTTEEKGPSPNLVLRGICNNELSSSFTIEKILSRPGLAFTAYRSKILSLFEKAMDLHLGKSYALFPTALSSPVKINEDEQKLLTEIAELLDLSLPADFFELGDLEKSGLSSIILGESNLHGSPEAREKYRAIQSILNMLEDMNEASPFIRNFKEVKCIALALENQGTSFDEDIRIQVALPKECALSLEDVLKLDRKTLRYMAYDCDFEGIFGIGRGSDFLAYDASLRRNHPIKILPYRIPRFDNTEDDNFDSMIPDLFDFDLIDKEPNLIIEVEFDEIMQHTAVAFPERLLLKDDISAIEYTIKSKHMPNVISGFISIAKEH